MLRESLAPDSACVAALFVPDQSREHERPGWNVQLLARAAAGASAAATSEKLAAPYVTYGRLMQPYWLRLERRGDTFVADRSADGENWIPVGTTTVRLKKEICIGLAACSRLKTVTTTVVFDRVTLPGWTP